MKKILIILFMFFALISNATNYYVATSANGGNDSNDGSSGSPWLTLSHAILTATTPGDTIHVGVGSFSESSQMSLEAGVSIVGAGETSVITLTYASDPAIRLYSATEGASGNQSISYLKFDGSSLAGYGAIYVYNRSDVSVHHCTFVDFKYIAAKFRATGEPPTTYPTGNSFHDNTTTNCSGYYGGNQYGSLEFDGQEGFLCYGNTMDQSTRTNLNGFVLKSVPGFNKGTKIYNNTLTRGHFDGVGFDFAIENWSGRGGIEIYNNTIEGEIDLGGYSSNDAGGYGFAFKIYGNDFGFADYGTHGDYGIQLEMFSNSTHSGGTFIYNNTFNHMTHVLWTSVSTTNCTFQDVHFYYNVIKNSGQQSTSYQPAINIYTGNSGNTFDNFNILNNVIYKGTTATGESNNRGIWISAAGSDVTNLTIRNNDVEGFTRYWFEADNAVINTISIENNNSYGNGNTNATYFAGTTTVTNKTEQNNIHSDPLFVSAATGDFSLQTGSPNINAGINVGLVSDFNGDAISGLPDIGAFEYGSAPYVKIYKLIYNAETGKYLPIVVPVN